jgi:hypothetical protein
MQGYVPGCLGGGGGDGHRAKDYPEVVIFFILVVSRPHSSVLFHRLASPPLPLLVSLFIFR